MATNTRNKSNHKTGSKATKRRDADPIRVYADGRIAYWSGGHPGEGTRRFTRAAKGETLEEAETRIRADIGNPQALKGGRTLLQLMGAYVDAHKDSSTLDKYVGVWNNHVLGVVGAVHCRDLSQTELFEVMRSTLAKDLAENTARGVSIAFRSVIAWGHRNGWFGKQHPLVDPRHPGGLSDDIESMLSGHYDPDRKENAKVGFGLDDVPSPEAVTLLAEHLETIYSGYRRYVRVLAASGIRIEEFVGLRVEDADLDAMTLRVRRGARRKPRTNATELIDTKATKDRHTRTVQLWGCAAESLAWMVDHAVDGWLVPPDDSQKWWLAVFNRRVNNACADLGWPEGQRCHSLRHHYGTYSVAAPPVGYGLSVTDVSRWMGHSSVTTTERYYLHALDASGSAALRATSRALG